jgi:hypothetical protein
MAPQNENISSFFIASPFNAVPDCEGAAVIAASGFPGK